MRRTWLDVVFGIAVLSAHCGVASGQDYVPADSPAIVSPATPPVTSSPDPAVPAPAPDFVPANYAPRSSLPKTEAHGGMLQGGVQEMEVVPPQVQTAPPPPMQPPPQQQLPPFQGYSQQTGNYGGGFYSSRAQYGMPVQQPPYPNPYVPRAPLQGQVQGNSPGRPVWMPAHAYTNDTMIAPYHNMNLFAWDKREIPNKPKWISLARSVTKYWRGMVPEPCMVLALPMSQAPGNFTFSSQSAGGPRGWLQNTGTLSSQGYPIYRYWFDQR